MNENIKKEAVGFVSSAILSDYQYEYLIEEMKAAHNRIEEEVKSINQFEILAMSIIGAIYFLFFNFKIVDTGLIRALSLLPIAVCIYGLARYTAHRGVIAIHERYIKGVIEPAVFSENRKFGLVFFYDEERSLLQYAGYLLWFAVLLFVLIFSATAFWNPEYVASFHGVPSAVSSVSESKNAR